MKSHMTPPPPTGSNHSFLVPGVCVSSGSDDAVSIYSLFEGVVRDLLIQTNLSIMLTSTIDLFGEISAIVTGKSMVFLSGLPGQSLNIARFGVVIVWGILPGDCIKGCASVQLQR